MIQESIRKHRDSNVSFLKKDSLFKENILTSPMEELQDQNMTRRIKGCCICKFFVCLFLFFTRPSGIHIPGGKSRSLNCSDEVLESALEHHRISWVSILWKSDCRTPQFEYWPKPRLHPKPISLCLYTSIYSWR